MADKEAVRVVLRCRPFSDKEKAAGHSNIVKMEPKAGTVIIFDPRNDRGQTDPPKTFTFDNCFDWNCTQNEVYSMTARDIVDGVLQGYNGTILAYGQTGTGKTFSMEGIRDVPELRGIIPNSFQHIFSYIKQAGEKTQFLVRASYLELYNEEVRDLLNTKSSKLEIKEKPDIGVYVKDLSTYVIQSVEEMDQLMTVGNKNRSVGYTEMNATSSRSHSIFTITVEASEMNAVGEQHIRAGKLHLVDLAGSERQSKTGASGDRLKEATKINLALSALGNVISALVDGKSKHIPYRDSKLTRLLQDSLGGNARTLMIATMSPASYNYDETISTLRYANRAKNIKNKPKINEDPKDAMLREFQEEIKRLKALLENAEGNGEEQIQEVEVIEEEEVSGDDEIPEERRSSVRRSRTSKTNQAELKRGISENTLATMQEKIKQEKAALLASKDMEESEKNRLLAEAEERELELEREKAARAEVASKLAQLENKLLVGGVNILDQHQQQQIILAKKAHEIAEDIKRQQDLEESLKAKEEINLQIEEEFTNLQEEAAAKTKKLKNMWNYYAEQRSELQDLKNEQQREREDLLETIREISNELKLRQAILGKFIPATELEIIYDCSEYDEVSGKWKIQQIAHAGNNIRGKTELTTGEINSSEHLHRDIRDGLFWDPTLAFPDPYMSYDIKGQRKKDGPYAVHRKKKQIRRSTIKVPEARGLVVKSKHYA